MPEAAAQDEFDALVNARPRVLGHPSDGVNSDVDNSDASDTLVNTSLASTNRSRKFADSTTHSIRTSRRNAKGSDVDTDDDSDDNFKENKRPDLGRKRNSAYYLPRQYNADSNTGPKGVIADAHAFEKEKARETAKGPRFGRTRDLALPRGQWSRPESEESASGVRLADEKNYERSDEEGSSGLDEGDDAFVKEWREARMREMQSHKESAQESRSPRRKAYGTLELVDAIGFLDAIELAREGDVVLVYIYDEHYPHDATYTSALQALAQKYNRTRIVALDYVEAEMEKAGVPALLAYRDGDKFADIVPLSAECPVKGEEDEDEQDEVVAKLERWLKGLSSR